MGYCGGERNGFLKQHHFHSKLKMMDHKDKYEEIISGDIQMYAWLFEEGK